MFYTDSNPLGSPAPPAAQPAGPGRPRQRPEPPPIDAKRIGVVSDTHNNLRSCRRIVELFNAAKVDAVFHTGDITQAKTLEVFGGLAMPLYGVFGNNDQERESLECATSALGFHFQDPPFQAVWAGQRIVAVHDPLEFPSAMQGECDLALHGHTHLTRIERNNGCLFFNPGECAGHMQGLNAVGVVALETLEARLLRF